MSSVNVLRMPYKENAFLKWLLSMTCQKSLPPSPDKPRKMGVSESSWRMKHPVPIRAVYLFQIHCALTFSWLSATEMFTWGKYFSAYQKCTERRKPWTASLKQNNFLLETNFLKMQSALLLCSSRHINSQPLNKELVSLSPNSCAHKPV